MKVKISSYLMAGNLNLGGKFKFWRENFILAGNSNYGGKFLFGREANFLAVI